MRTSRSGTTTSAGGAVPRPRSSPGRGARDRAGTEGSPETPPQPGRNEVLLSGRLGAQAEERELPSGDRIATLRVVVPREQSTGRRRTVAEAPRRATVDTIDVVCWTAATRRSALRLREGDVVEVEGALRRRFFGGPAGRQSRYEVEAVMLRRVSGGGRAGT
jgi:single-strand DNA-binding protein